MAPLPSPPPLLPHTPTAPVSHLPLVPKAHSSPGKPWAPQIHPALPILSMGCACGGLPLRKFSSPVYFLVLLIAMKLSQSLKKKSKISQIKKEKKKWHCLRRLEITINHRTLSALPDMMGAGWVV